MVDSGSLPASQLSYTIAALPAEEQLFADLYTMTSGVWTSWEAITFTAAPGATFTYPTRQSGVDTTRLFTWSTIPAAQSYYLVVGTTPLGYDLVNSGVLPATRSSFPIPPLPTGRTLYAAVLTMTDGVWTRWQTITFTT